MKQSPITVITQCVVCSSDLTMRQLQKQSLYNRQSIQDTTCSNNCRTKYYRERKAGLR